MLKFSKTSLSLFVLTGILFFTFQVWGHDAWVEPTMGPVYRILYGHKVPEAYKARKVTDIKVLDANQRLLTYSRTETKDGMNIKTAGGTPAIFAVEYDNGYWVKVGGESQNVRKSQMPAGTEPSRLFKFSKTIVNWQPWMSRPFGQRIEFVPVKAAAAPKAGTQLKLQLLLDGKPMGGQRVENNSNEQGPKTDAAGFVTVTVLKGINRYATDYDISQPHDPDAQRLSLTAALVFTAK